jgi:hypothetical protein
MVAPSFCLSYLALFPGVGGAHAVIVLNVSPALNPAIQKNNRLNASPISLNYGLYYLNYEQLADKFRAGVSGADYRHPVYIFFIFNLRYHE